MNYKNISLLCLLLTGLILGGCQTPNLFGKPPIPIDIKNINLKAPEDIQLPIGSAVDIYIPSDIGSSTGGYNLLIGVELEKAAEKTFPLVFSQVDIVSDPSTEFVATVISAKGSDLTGDFGLINASVTMKFFHFSGDEIGTFSGSGSAFTSNPKWNNIALQKAFVKSLIEILKQLLDDKKFFEKVKIQQLQ